MADPHDAYVPGFQHDLFVSYAWADDRVPGASSDTSGWVHALASGLEDLLRMQLGRTDWGRLWIDSRVDSAQRITPEVEAALRGSALLLVVLSEGWLASPWCAHELELFLARHGHDGARGRIFVLHGAAVEPDRRPEPIRDLRGFDL